MAHVFPGRYTAQIDEPFAVFIIGMRVNQILRLGSWLRVARAMPRMLAELYRHPEMGFLHGEIILYWRGVGLIQYWRSFDHLHAYAHDREAAHLPAWADFNRRIGASGSVGIWHETYLVERGSYESIYANMPAFGLARASTHVPVTGRLESAQSRIARARSE